MNHPRRRLTLLALFAMLLAPVAALAQQGPKGESDEAFMVRMERQMNDLASRAENLDRLAREGTHPELRSLRLRTRSLKKRIAKEHEQMAEQYVARDEVGFDRERWQAVARQFDADLTKIERGLRPF